MHKTVSAKKPRKRKGQQVLDFFNDKSLKAKYPESKLNPNEKTGIKLGSFFVRRKFKEKKTGQLFIPGTFSFFGTVPKHYQRHAVRFSRTKILRRLKKAEKPLAEIKRIIKDIGFYKGFWGKEYARLRAIYTRSRQSTKGQAREFRSGLEVGYPITSNFMKRIKKQTPPIGGFNFESIEALLDHYRSALKNLSSLEKTLEFNKEIYGSFFPSAKEKRERKEYRKKQIEEKKKEIEEYLKGLKD